MEFPQVGKNCSGESCRRLDFLPVICDSCKQTFCSDHFSYDKHSCPVAKQQDVQVPVCPLCGEPVPTPRNVSPDVTVGRHLDENCSSKKSKIYTNRCTFERCKKKELVPFTCSDCKRNFCLAHRHFADHKCTGPARESDVQRNLRAEAAASRQTPWKNATRVQPNTNQVQAVQGNMSEDEALARALALSMQEESNQRPPTQTPVPCGNGSNKDRCRIC